MKLTIIIPQYKEPEEVIFPLLSSINNQLGIDFSQLEVLVVNDCSNVILKKRFLSQFVNIKPRYIKLKKNVGLGMCRKAGMEHATGDYVMFCDADDMFYHASALALFFNEIDMKHPDICTSSWLEEQKINGCWHYLQHKIEATWVHGKIFRRQFLIDNDINFHPKFRVHEDTYFVGLAFDMTTNKNYLDNITYVWKYNENSFTRRDNASFSYKEFSVFIESVIELIRAIETRKPELLPYRVAQFLLYVYFSFHLPYWNIEDSFQYKQKCEEIFSGFFKSYARFYEQYPEEKFKELYKSEKEKLYSTREMEEKESLESFIRRMGGYSFSD